MVEVKKKNNESFESLIRRFSKKVMQSGRIIQAKKVRFLKNSPNKRARKISALRRQIITGKREYLRKIGKLDELIAARKPIKIKKIK
ncbi:MAG: 30S ribosomal protein S21 [Candidatus Komeilibacteria bacterium]|nr:30S ribosomal protein S21 [Candidatus Komeilibacteria bacterium]